MAETPLPFQYSFLAGAIAGVSEIIATYPLDVVKTRLQIQVGNSEYKSIGDCFRKIIKNEGLGTLYRGILPPIMVEAPKRAIKFSANEQYKKLYIDKFQFQPSVGLGMLTGMSAGVTEAMVVATPDLLKIRLQDKKNKALYSSTYIVLIRSDVIRHIIRNEGLYGLGRGIEATILRHGVWNAGYFGIINFVKDALPKAESKEGTLLYNFIAGTIGGITGTALNTPFDVVKTRFNFF